MPKLPVVSGAEIVKVSSKSGYAFVRQSGSHIILKNADGQVIVIPNHKCLKKGTFLQILKNLDLTKEEFIKLL